MSVERKCNFVANLTTFMLWERCKGFVLWEPVMRCLWIVLGSVLWVAACGPSMSMEAHERNTRRQEAKRLRAGTPERAKLPESTESHTKTHATKTDTGEDASGGGKAAIEPVEVEALPKSLDLGIYRIAERGVVDGDTVKVEGLDASLRLLAIDTEETFKKKKKDRAAAESDFYTYAKKKRGDSEYPAKYATPMGEEAAEWAKEWFVGIDEVKLEYDELGRTRGVFGRHLVYVFAQKNGVWVNYNVECVRAGMSPYFPKYGYSKRYHSEFVEAQDEARMAKRGIWADNVVGAYPDYDERLEWWERRAQAIQHFEEKHLGKEDMFQLGQASEWTRLEKKVGETVTVFGAFGRSSLKKTPYLLRMSHKKGVDFTIVAFDEAQLQAVDLLKFKGEYFYVRGKLSAYRGRPQFKATDVEKAWME